MSHLSVAYRLYWRRPGRMAGSKVQAPWVRDALSGDRAPKSRRTRGSCPEGALNMAPHLLLRQRVEVAHQALQPFLHHMGIDLRGRDVGMTEQGLDDAQVGAIVQKVA